MYLGTTGIAFPESSLTFHIQPATISELRKASFWHSAGASPPEKLPKSAPPAIISLCKHTFCSCEWNPLTGMVSALIIGSPACAKRKLVSVHLSRFQIGFWESPAWGKEAKFSSGRKSREMLAHVSVPGSSPAGAGDARGDNPDWKSIVFSFPLLPGQQGGSWQPQYRDWCFSIYVGIQQGQVNVGISGTILFHLLP